MGAESDRRGLKSRCVSAECHRAGGGLPDKGESHRRC